MSRFTNITIFFTLLLSSAAAYLGHYTDVIADDYQRYGLYVLPRNAPSVAELLAMTKSPRIVVSDLDENPFSHDDINGVPVPKDPDRRAKLAESYTYQKVSRYSFAVAKVIPILAVIVLCFRAMHNAMQKCKRDLVQNVLANELLTDSTTHDVSLETQPHSKEFS